MASDCTLPLAARQTSRPSKELWTTCLTCLNARIFFATVRFQSEARSNNQPEIEIAKDRYSR